MERVLASKTGVLGVYVNPATETAYVDIDPSKTDAWTVWHALEQAGYRAGRPSEP